MKWYEIDFEMELDPSFGDYKGWKPCKVFTIAESKEAAEQTDNYRFVTEKLGHIRILGVKEA